MEHLSVLPAEPFSDEIIHLQPPIHILQMQIAAQRLNRFQLDENDEMVLEAANGSVELLVLDQDGHPALEKIDILTPATYLMTSAQHTLAQLQQESHTAHALQKQFDQYQLCTQHLQQVSCIEGFEILKIKAKTAVQVFVLNTGPDLDITSPACLDEIKVIIHKAQSVDAYLPEPLANPVQEIHVPRASARTYHVKKGQWIQIIDVSGKQCSDFLAFDQQALEQAHEIGLDAVATRTILGQSTPRPGLHSRFYGSDMQSMVEVIQDTVGRHDMFLTACSPKFYNDAGYFGHISCTDNFNQVLKPYGIAARDAWPAINFFYNTFVQDCGSIGLDEPWSRPGDYVLLRANRDLVCASSACPDEIDPSNGWVPTDIHVRIYAETEEFKRSQHYRIHPEEQPRMLSLIHI